MVVYIDGNSRQKRKSQATVMTSEFNPNSSRVCSKYQLHTRATQQIEVLVMAHLIGLLISSHPAVHTAPLHIRALQRAKIQALRHAWIIQLSGDYGVGSDERPTVVDTTTGSSSWSSHCSNLPTNSPHLRRIQNKIESIVSTGGRWTPVESSLHINVLELRFALKSFESLVSGKHGLIQMDNRTVVTYLNKVGGTHAKDLSDLALQIWQWSLERNIVITAEYLPGKECDSRSGITP